MTDNSIVLNDTLVSARGPAHSVRQRAVETLLLPGQLRGPVFTSGTYRPHYSVFLQAELGKVGTGEELPPFCLFLLTYPLTLITCLLSTRNARNNFNDQNIGTILKEWKNKRKAQKQLQCNVKKG